MRNYLLYSSSAHFVFLLAVFFLAPGGPARPKKEQAYFIDFVGGGKITAMQAAGKTEPAPAPAAAKAAPKPDEDDFSSGPLPKPSVLGGAVREDAPQPAVKPQQQASAEDGDGAGETALVTDSNNFPYPWYLAQVREALWNAWTGKMPSGGRLRATVRFTIKRSGDIKSVAVEKSSGNRLFDYAAEASAQSAAPFAPLPDDFYEDTLTVHVEFKTVE